MFTQVLLTTSYIAKRVDCADMLRLLIDQDLDHFILRGLLLRVPNLDVITAHQAISV